MKIKDLKEMLAETNLPDDTVVLFISDMTGEGKISHIDGAGETESEDDGEKFLVLIGDISEE